jgi:mono/diheme cytochrome c family protein
MKRYISQSHLILLVTTLAGIIFYTCTRGSKRELPNGFERKVLDKDPPITPLSPEESMRLIQLPPGFHMELVAAEPMVQEPVAISWDGNGRMYVAEMNTFMKDANASGEMEPTSRIKLLVDTNGDGKMDKATIFADSLLLPRAILTVGNELLVQETNKQHIWSYVDRNGDGVADEKKIIFRNDALDVRNVEHQNGGLIWNMDNWIYPTRDNLRYKYQNGILVADTMVDNMIGQWGITTDNYGRLFYSEAGPGLPAVQFEQMPAYGALNFKDQYTEEFTIPWPIIGTVDAQGGKDALRAKDNTLNKFTSGCGQSIFRGDKMPADMQGDYFIPEPVGRIIKRGKITNKDGKIYLADAYKEQDWLASADMNFRPINTYTGPDGCFYVVDMYHGIIQESEWTKPDSYLGKMIEKKGLYKNRGMGRIYRIVHDGYLPDRTKPNMLNASGAQLVTWLDHPNGWWRDHAQQEMIVRNDQSLVPGLRRIILGEADSSGKTHQELARIHALWTLEGLRAIDHSIIFAALQDKHPQVRKAAIWVSEPLVRSNDGMIMDRLSKLINDSSADVRFQLLLSLRTVQSNKAKAIVKALLDSNPKNELIQYSYKTFIESQNTMAAEKQRTLNLSPAERELVEQGATRFKQLCATCHGPDGKGVLIGGKQMPAPPLAGSPRVKGDKILLIQLLLNGLRGPVDGKTYPDIMASMASNDDQWIASVLSFIRNSAALGNNSSTVSPEEVKHVRAELPKIPGGMSMQELEIFKLGRAERTNWSQKKDKDGQKK